jgi:hypothetical protein
MTPKQPVGSLEIIKYALNMPCISIPVFKTEKKKEKSLRSHPVYCNTTTTLLAK